MLSKQTLWRLVVLALDWRTAMIAGVAQCMMLEQGLMRLRMGGSLASLSRLGGCGISMHLL